MLNSSQLASWFDRGLSYAKYLETGTEEHQRRWMQVYEKAHVTAAQHALVESFRRSMKLLILSGTWCGDCVQQVPLIQRIAEANEKRIDLRLLDRDQNKALMDHFRINGGDRVPAVIFLSEDNEFCGLAGDRTLARYRAIAQKQLGAFCMTGIVPPDQEEITLTLQDWLNEIERVQLMLRISPRLRQQHGD